MRPGEKPSRLLTQPAGGRQTGECVRPIYQGHCTTVVDYSLRLPSELLSYPQWVCWRSQPGPNHRIAKIPVNCNTGGNAAVDDPKTWTTYAAARTYAERRGLGLGFVLTDKDHFIFIDWDGCRDPQTGEIDPQVLAEAVALNTYVEISPSGKGLHAVGIGQLPPGHDCKGRDGEIEIYSTRHFLTITGQHLNGTPTEITDCGEQLAALYHRAFAPVQDKPLLTVSVSSLVDISDLELVQRASNAANGNGALFRKLWDGDTTGYPSPSEADLALCNVLAFWTGGDSERIDRLFRQSGLYRSKWDKRRGADTYGSRTIAKAVADLSAVYEPSTFNREQREMAVDTVAADESPEARIAALEAKVAGLEAKLKEAEERQRLTMAVLRNSALKTERVTMLATVFEYESQASRGLADEHGWMRIRRKALSEISGNSRQRVGSQVKTLADYGLFERDRRVEPTKTINKETGEITYPLRPAIYIRLRGTASETLAAAANFQPDSEHAKHWGGKQPVHCPIHPNAPVIKQYICSECGDVLEPVLVSGRHKTALSTQVEAIRMSTEGMSTGGGADDAINLNAHTPWIFPHVDASCVHKEAIGCERLQTQVEAIAAGPPCPSSEASRGGLWFEDAPGLAGPPCRSCGGDTERQGRVVLDGLGQYLCRECGKMDWFPVEPSPGGDGGDWRGALCGVGGVPEPFGSG